MSEWLKLDRVQHATVEYGIKEIVKRASNEDFHVQYTPIELCKEVVQKIIDQGVEPGKKWLVIANLEFLFVVRAWFKYNGLSLDDLYYAGASPRKLRFAGWMLGNENVIQYKYESIKSWEPGMKFDVIVGNPPYQGKKVGGGDGSGNAIWQNFVEISFKFCNEDGYVVLVHPSAWRFGLSKKLAKAQKLLFGKQIIYLKTQFPFPGATVMCDWYVSQNKLKTMPTLGDFLDGKIKIMIPNNPMYLGHYQSDILKSILKKILRTQNNGLYSRISWGGLVIQDETKPDGQYLYANGTKFLTGKYKSLNKPHIHQFNKKVIIPAVGSYVAHYDDGKLGIGDHVHYVLVGSNIEGLFLERVVNSKIGKFLNVIFRTHPNEFSNSPEPIKQIMLESIELKSDEDIFHHYNITQEEHEFIEKTIQ